MKRNKAIDNGKQQICDIFRACIQAIFVEKKKIPKSIAAVESLT